mmetsp:Transcript_8581/g.16584  ORF Transcript_8581/g.16584 Transcript_8581/m.16584 type:complete len:183 (-) Transcript_8581:564-1112(-)
MRTTHPKKISFSIPILILPRNLKNNRICNSIVCRSNPLGTIVGVGGSLQNGVVATREKVGPKQFVVDQEREQNVHQQQEQQRSEKQHGVQVSDLQAATDLEIVVARPSLEGDLFAHGGHVFHVVPEESLDHQLVKYVVDGLQKAEGRKIQKDFQRLVGSQHDAKIDRQAEQTVDQSQQVGKE